MSGCSRRRSFMGFVCFLALSAPVYVDLKPGNAKIKDFTANNYS